MELKRKKEHYSTRIADKGKGLEKYKQFTGKEKQTINELKLSDSSLTNPKDIAEGFND